jgi:hypothetical protein
MDRQQAEGDLCVGLEGKHNEGGEAIFYALWIASKVAGIGQEQTLLRYEAKVSSPAKASEPVTNEKCPLSKRKRP